MDQLSWNPQVADGQASDRRRLALCEAVLGQIATGVAVLEPSSDADRSLELVMLNEVAALYFGWIGPVAAGRPGDAMLIDAFRGLRESGVLALIELVSLTGRAHHQESVVVPGAAAVGHVVDLCITPIDASGAVSLTFVDVTHRVRQAR